MEWAFLLFVVIYLVYSVWSNRQPENPIHQRSRLKLYGIQGPLFLLACALAWQAGAFGRGLVSLPHIGAGLVIGHLVFGLSLLATHRKIGDTLQVLFDFRALWNFIVEMPGLFFRFLLVSLSEEVIYRVALQGSLLSFFSNLPGAAAWAVLLTALAFSVVHWHFFRNRFLDSVEFALFALLLGLAYWWTESLALVVVIHTMRNLEIVYLEYMRHVIESGSETTAMEAIERQYIRGKMEAS